MKIGFVNAKVFTGKNENDFISEFSIKNSKFCEINNVNRNDCNKIIDLKNACVIPALSDTHTHPTYVSQIIDSLACTKPYVANIPQLIEFLKTSPNYGKENKWIKGWCYDESKLDEKRAPTIKDLDLISSTQPVFILRSCCHSCVCNSKALELANITKDTKEPKGGKIGRFEDGTPNGIMYDLGASMLIRNAMEKESLEDEAKKLVKLGEIYASLGIVNISDMMCYSKPLKAYELYKLAKNMGLKQRVSLYQVYKDAKEFGLFKSLEDIKTNGIKFFVDGTISSQTAFTHKPYKNSDNYGDLVCNINEIKEAIDFAKNNNCQISFHLMGDKAIDIVIDNLTSYENWLKDYPSVRFEHASMLNLKHIEKIKKLKVKIAISTQPIFQYAEYTSYEDALEDDRFNSICALNTLKEFLDLSISSDAPATIHHEPFNLFVSINAAVVRTNPNGKNYNKNEEISVEDAILMLTKNSQNILMLKNCTTIEDGKSADFIVLDNDIFSIDKTKIKDIKVHQTWLKGERIY